MRCLPRITCPAWMPCARIEMTMPAPRAGRGFADTASSPGQVPGQGLKPGLKPALLICLALWLHWTLCIPAFAQDMEYDLDFAIPEVQAPSPVRWAGSLESKAISRILDKDALLYQQRYAHQDQPGSFSEFTLTFKPELTLRQERLGLYLRPRMTLGWSEERRPAPVMDEPSARLFSSSSRWSGALMLEEGTVSLSPDHNLSLDAGKKVVKWGKGYAWNPVAFAARPKDVDDPDKTREGYVLLSGEWIKSLDGPVSNVGLNPVLVPVGRDVNADLADKDTLLAGAKLTLLAWDTDVDLLFMDGSGYDQRLGLALARNLAPHFVVHGELALRRGLERVRVDEQGLVSSSRKDAVSLLLGLRYVNRFDTTFILEYLRNGEGYSRAEMRDYLDLIAAGISGDGTARENLLQASRDAASRYNKNSVMRDYLYLRASHKEPFDILYFTPALTVIANLQDHSSTVNPEIVYSPWQNYEFKAKLGIPLGPSRSEYGEKMHKVRGELTLTRYF